MTQCYRTIIILGAMLCLGCAPDDSARRRPLSPARSALLAHYDDRYDAQRQMVCLEFDSPGYHSKIPSGTPTHPTRESLVYALALLQRGAPGDAQRAADVIEAVLPLQDTDPASATYGIWPWLAEEPLAEMADPDFNWADFCGAHIAQMLVEHDDSLPDELRQQMRRSLDHATRAIRQRDVKPGYTNIAIVGGGVCAAAGELLDDPDLLDYGRRRLQQVVEHTARHGGFNEYNSPTYTRAAIAECERTLQTVRDPATRAAAESLRRTAWRTVADSFHAGTQQWAGPHSRSYQDRLRAEVAGFLARRTGVAIHTHPSMIAASEPDEYAVIAPLPCPEELLPRFRAAPDPPRQVSRSFFRSKTPTASRVGTTWLAADACLGSVNRSILWTQRKPLLGYWRTGDDPAVVFRLRFLHDGRDFASMGVAIAQDGPRTLSLLYGVPDRGDWHPSLDRPADGVFHATDLRLRLELRGHGVAASDLGEGRYELSAGNRRVVIHTCPGRFAGDDVRWQLSREPDHVFLDGVCHQGDSRPFDFRDPLPIQLAIGVELLRADAPVAECPPTFSQSAPTELVAEWEFAEDKRLTVRNNGCDGPPRSRSCRARRSAASEGLGFQVPMNSDIRPAADKVLAAVAYRRKALAVKEIRDGPAAEPDLHSLTTVQNPIGRQIARKVSIGLVAAGSHRGAMSKRVGHTEFGCRTPSWRPTPIHNGYPACTSAGPMSRRGSR